MNFYEGKIYAVLPMENKSTPGKIELKDLRKVLDKKGMLYHL